MEGEAFILVSELATGYYKFSFTAENAEGAEKELIVCSKSEIRGVGAVHEPPLLDSRFHGNDGKANLRTFYEDIIFELSLRSQRALR